MTKTRLSLAGVTACALALPAAVWGSATAAESPDVTSAAGVAPAIGDFDDVTLTLLIHPTLFAAMGGDEGLVGEFEEQTGATVEVVTAPIGEHLERSMAEFAAGSGRLDVINMQGQDLHDQITPFLLDLEPYVSEAADWNYEDFPASLRDPATGPDGEIAGIPYRIGVNIMYFRSDLLEQAGVSAPTNFEELRTVAAALKEEFPDITPLVQRGKAEEIVHDWLGFLHAAGGSLLNDDYTECLANSEAGVKAAELWAEFYSEGYLPEDLFAIGRDEYIGAMRQGRAAMGIYFSPYWGTITEEGPEFVDSMDWTLMPTEEGVDEGRAWFQAWYLTVAKDSANPEAAWALVQYITNEENSLRGALEWANGPVRESVYNSAEYQEQFPLAEDWLTAIAASSPLPAVSTNTQIVDVLSGTLTEIVSGGTGAQDGLDGACDAINDLL